MGFRLVPFLVGFGSSLGFSFAIIEKIRDRRCLYLMNSRADEDMITSYIYNTKLKDLIMEQALASDSETYLMQKSREMSSQSRIVVNRIFRQIHEWMDQTGVSSSKDEKK